MVVLFSLFCFALRGNSCRQLLTSARLNHLQIQPAFRYRTMQAAKTNVNSTIYEQEESTLEVNSSLAKLRREYSSAGIEDESSLDPNPIVVFQKWFDEACASKVHEPNAMCLATADAITGTPSVRIVLLKGFDERGFVWYTNYESRKGQDLKDVRLDATIVILRLSMLLLLVHAAVAGDSHQPSAAFYCSKFPQNPKASLLFWWGPIERSVRIEGSVEKVASEESDLYFSMRPPKARLGAIASDQSRVISSRADLVKKFEHLSEAYLDQEGQEKAQIVRPLHWGGYRLTPNMVEFWKGRSSRIHDRIRYTRDEKDASISWTKDRLQP